MGSERSSHLFLSDGTPVTPGLVGYDSIGDVSGEGHIGFTPVTDEGEENNPTLYFETEDVPLGERVRAAANIIEQVAEEIPEADEYDEDVLAAFEGEHGEVRPRSAILRDVTSVLRTFSIIADVAEREEDGD